MRKQFLIIQTAFLGDAVLATSILEKLHAHYPDAAIDLVVRKGNDGLFTAHPFLRTLHVWDKRESKTRSLIKLIGILRKQRYDHVINAQRFFSTGLMTALSGGKETTGYDKNPLSFLFSRKVKHQIPEPAELRKGPVKSDAVIIHEVDRLNDLIVYLTDGLRPLPKLYPSAADRSLVEQVIRPQHSPTGSSLKTPAGSLAEDPAAPGAQQGPEAEILREKRGPYITIAPASVWFTKQWPAEKWIELIKVLPVNRRIFLIGAPGDIPLCERIIKEAGRGEVLAGKLSLLGTAALMEGAAMNYVNDSAPLHIASAMNAPVTVVFCSTVPNFGFGPLNANGHIVERTEPLYCRPCGLHGYQACPEGHFKCAWEIDVSQAAGFEGLTQL